jgi:diguanylate cyclase (GGDEF)-like protein
VWGIAVPSVVNAHFILDVPTLFAVTVFISLSGGLLLLFSWMQNRNTPALALWGIGYVIAASAAALLSSHLLPGLWPACLGNALICLAYGMMWSGSRCFEGRRVHLWLTAMGAVIWLIAFQFEIVAQSLPLRMALASMISASYALLSARELWHARDRGLISRWPTLVLVVVHAGFLLARIPFADSLTSAVLSPQSHGPSVTVMAFEALFAAFCVPFLRVAMSKERAELEQRRAALTDSLTGIANRRAFFDVGEPLLDRLIADRRSAALLLFDLDRFKEVNDTAGHQTGDYVLKSFADLVAASMRSGDLFGRLGGEEFASLLLNVSMAEALQMAERLRAAFETMQVPGLDVKPTVSVGVAMTTEAGRGLTALLATADRALYRAKADGRNRVARAPLVLVDKHGGVARTLQVVKAPTIAPIAG